MRGADPLLLEDISQPLGLDSVGVHVMAGLDRLQIADPAITFVHALESALE